ncbi:hypothetical protein LCGC14_0647980 [marine sediment metagenome]|uniref:Uncharacterized protein n=1 Tax=marine sediment metagenome TaxID=412755 RepID=A0A0F9R2G5_9ZZZZ
MNAQTEQAHKDLRNLLLNGRILVNGLSLTGNELGVIIQGEQLLFAKASQLDAANELLAKQKEPKEPKKKSNIVPIKQPEKK